MDPAEAALSDERLRGLLQRRLRADGVVKPPSDPECSLLEFGEGVAPGAVDIGEVAVSQVSSS